MLFSCKRDQPKVDQSQRGVSPLVHIGLERVFIALKTYKVVWETENKLDVIIRIGPQAAVTFGIGSP